MDDRNRIVDFLQKARTDSERKFGRTVQEIAGSLDLPIERVEFLAIDLEKKGEISLAVGVTPGEMLADVGQYIVRGAR